MIGVFFVLEFICMTMGIIWDGRVETQREREMKRLVYMSPCYEKPKINTEAMCRFMVDSHNCVFS